MLYVSRSIEFNTSLQAKIVTDYMRHCCNYQLVWCMRVSPVFRAASNETLLLALFPSHAAEIFGIVKSAVLPKTKAVGVASSTIVL